VHWADIGHDFYDKKFCEYKYKYFIRTFYLVLHPTALLLKIMALL